MKRNLLLLSIVFLIVVLFSCKPEQEQVATPVLSPPTGVYTSIQSVTISCATADTTIRYTTDGTDPSETVGTVYSSVIEVSEDTVIKAIAYKDGMDDSQIASAIYAMNVLQVATPVFSPSSGTILNNDTEITITTATPDASIYYTRDGSTPTTSSELYSDLNKPIVDGAHKTIKAIAVKTGIFNSTIAEITYTLIVLTPTFSVPSGTYDGFQFITISCATTDAETRYTLDGTDPSETVGTVYSTPVKISNTKTLKAMSYKSGMAESEIASADYIIPYRDFVYVPSGTFTQQDTNGHSFSHTISAFNIGKYEVTYNLWYEVYQWAISNTYQFDNAGREGNDGIDGEEPTTAKYEPVTYISWQDLIVWCNAYSEMMGYTPCYTYEGSVVRDSTNATACDGAVCNWVANGYRLPTEGEWQYAASYIDGSSWIPYNHASGDVTSYCYPNDGGTSTVFGNYAWYNGNSESTTHDVGTKNANALGIYDMSGNVYELCWDWSGTYPTDAQIDYRGSTSGYYRVIRGCSYYFDSYQLQVGYRDIFYQQYGRNDLGFRLVSN